jgi:hypothetical protein
MIGAASSSPSGVSASVAGRHGDPNLEVEKRHHSVSYELLDRAAVPLELAAQTLPVRAEHGAHVLGIEPLRTRPEPDEVGEEHGDNLALLAPRLGGERRDAGRAEAGARRIFLFANGTARHRSESMTWKSATRLSV